MLTAALLVAVAAYAQYRIGFHTATRARAALTRVVLALVGVGLGYVAAAYALGGSSVAAFLSGFGLVHLPAAMILFAKRMRGEGKS